MSINIDDPPTPSEISTALDQLNEQDRTAWIERLSTAATNLKNTAHGLAGNLPEAKPDPVTWSTNWLSLGITQLALVLEELEATDKPRGVRVV
ncbi:hypothetical protein D3248_01815 [Leucobacter zeae]|nr:hypothetical protein [Leucobacter zeae]